MKYLSLKIFLSLVGALFFFVLSSFSPSYADTEKIYVTNSADNTVSVIDGVSLSTIATIPTGNFPSGIVVNSFKNRLYVTNLLSSSLYVIDLSTNTLISTIFLGTDNPLSLTLNKDGTQLYVVGKNDGKVYIIDTITNKIIKTLSGFILPQNVLVNQHGDRLYIVNTNNYCCTVQNGYISVIDLNDYHLVTNIPVGIAPNGAAISPDGAKLFIGNQGAANINSTISVIDTIKNAVVGLITVGVNPTGMALNSTGTRLYVTNTYFGAGGYNDTVHGTVSVIDTTTDSVIATVPVGYVPNFLAISGDDSKVYVANTGGTPVGNTVSVIDTATNTVTGTIIVGNAPWGITVAKNTSASSPPDINLSVPSIKQYDLPWGIETYDFASKWSPQNPTISRWGCALTSAAMVFQYYGIKKLPSGVDLNPGTLNTWLRFEKDGYIGDGIVNWLALQRLSKKAVLANNISAFDALQYQYKNFEDTQSLIAGLESKNPGILEESIGTGNSHFVVAKGIKNGDIKINDPYDHWESLDQGYGGHFAKLGQFAPSHTDLSYILLVSDSFVTFSLKDTQGNNLANSFIQHPIDDDIEGGSANAKSETLLYSSTPPTGLYDIHIQTADTKPHVVKAYLYDVEGNVTILTETIPFNLFPSTDLSLNFNKTDSSRDMLSKQFSALFSKVFADLVENYWLGNIDKGSFDSLNALLTDAQKEYLSGHIAIAQKKLSDVTKILSTKREYGISEGSYQLLLSDLNLLSTSL